MACWRYHGDYVIARLALALRRALRAGEIQRACDGVKRGSRLLGVIAARRSLRIWNAPAGDIMVIAWCGGLGLGLFA
jgi:hypothetical protein